MGKRSDFKRVEKDYYRTIDPRAVDGLLRYVDPCVFIEPCAGDGSLVRMMEDRGFTCKWAGDLEPKERDISQFDVFDLDLDHRWPIITNPPWSRKLLHPLIAHFIKAGGAHLLFDADWVHTKQSQEFTPWLRTYTSVGRLKWIEGTSMSGKDNVAWYEFAGRRVRRTRINPAGRSGK